ncbi:hypothetical protein JCM5353_008378 [Sporobolomyces roseus]
MLLYTTIAFALVGTAFAAPAAVSAERRHPALAVTQAFRQLEKRQSDSSTVQALSSLQDLLGKAVTSTSSKGQCSSECSGWVDAVTDCTDLGSYTQIGYCACGDTPLSAMNTCGDCYGGSSATDSDNFSSFCREALASSGGGGSASPFTSSRSSGSYSSRASPTMILDTETYSARSTASAPQAPQESASNAGSPTPAPGSGAGSIKVGFGMAAGVVGCVVVALYA